MLEETDFEQFCISSWEPNKDLLLGKYDNVILKILGNQCPGEAEIRIRFFPKATLEIKMKFSIKDKKILPNNEEAQVCFNNGKELINVPVLEPFFWGNSEMILTPTREPLIFGEKAFNIKFITFHLFNFKDIFGMRLIKKVGNSTSSVHQIFLNWRDWQIEIRSLSSNNETYKILKEQGGYGLTHIGRLRKSRGDLFSYQDAKNILDALRDFLSFANGSKRSPVFCQGFDENGSKVLEILNAPDEPLNEALSWVIQTNHKQLPEFFPLFMEKYFDGTWRKTFHDVIYWYLNSNQDSRGIDAGIILTQCAIELLSYEFFVNYRKLIKPKKFKEMWASEKFRLLFSSLGIPIDIPMRLSNMQKLANQLNCSDAPRVLTEVRNLLVHPDKKNQQEPNQILSEAWNLGLWYLEMGVLGICGYNGKIQNRWNSDWANVEENVPWIKI